MALTPREAEVVRLIRRGYRVGEIARRWHVATATVKNTATRANTKLGKRQQGHIDLQALAERARHEPMELDLNVRHAQACGCGADWYAHGDAPLAVRTGYSLTRVERIRCELRIGTLINGRHHYTAAEGQQVRARYAEHRPEAWRRRA